MVQDGLVHAVAGLCEVGRKEVGVGGSLALCYA